MTCFSFKSIKVKSLQGLLNVCPFVEFIIQLVQLKVFTFAVQELRNFLSHFRCNAIISTVGGTELQGFGIPGFYDVIMYSSYSLLFDILPECQVMDDKEIALGQNWYKSSNIFNFTAQGSFYSTPARMGNRMPFH